MQEMEQCNKNPEENVEVFSRHSDTQGSRKEPNITNSRSSRRRQIDKIELQNLRAKKEPEKRLQERQLEIKKEREELEFRLRQEELRLKLQQQEDKLLLRQHERELKSKRKKAEDDEVRFAWQLN